MQYILGIESTCDETAAAIIDINANIISQITVSQQSNHALYGGVVPELASRMHLQNIESVLNKLFKESNKIGLSDISAVACSTQPGLIGGILVGSNFAKSLAVSLSIPFISVDHLEAHLFMPFMFYEINFPTLAILISGGHCQIAYIRNFEQIDLLGNTLDDSIGETFDKVAQMLNISYPGGPLIEKYALLGNEDCYKFPLPLTYGKNLNNQNFSFSGLKTAVKIQINSLKNNGNLSDFDRNNICASFQKTILNILKHKIDLALENYPFVKNIVISGGVASNKYLRQSLSNYFNNLEIYYPPIEFCTDNGVMIAFAGLLKFKKQISYSIDCMIKSTSNLF